MKKSRRFLKLFAFVCLSLILVGCDWGKPDPHVHDMMYFDAKEATCVTNGRTECYMCTVCGKFYSDETGIKEVTDADVIIPALGHTMEKVSAKDATCTTDGNKEYYSCSQCNKYFSDAMGNKEIKASDTVIAAGHHATHHDAVEASCVTDGSIEYYSCDVCNKVFSDKACTNEITLASTVVKGGHELTLNAAVSATCTTDGNIEHYSCGVCGKFFSDSEGKVELSASDVVISASHSLEFHAAVSATCTTDGSVSYYSCSVCGKNYADSNAETKLETVVVGKLGHDEIHHDAVSATCTSAGCNEYVTCSRCDYSTYVELPMLGHSVSYVELGSNNCAANGIAGYYVCSSCNKTFADEACTNEIAVSITGHSMVKHDEVSATCTASGVIEYYECSACGKLFSDVDGNTEISSSDLVLPHLGHDLVFHEAVAHTCTEDGTIAYYSCSRCEEMYSDSEGTDEVWYIVDRAEHSFVKHEAVISDNASSNVEYYSCSVCDKVFSDNNASSETTLDQVSFIAHIIKSGQEVAPGYSVTHSSNYRFNDTVTPGVYVSNNQGQHSTYGNNTDCVMTITATKAGVVYVTYTVSCEPLDYDGYGDQLVIGEHVFSGERSGVVAISVNAGDTVRIKFAKDSWDYAPAGDDTATVSVAFLDSEVYSKYTITFDTVGGEEMAPVEVYASMPVVVSDPVKANSTFGGWYLEASYENAVDFASGVTSDITVYAKWSSGVEVSYSVNGSVVASEEIASGTTYTAITPSSVHYMIEGWYTDSELTNAFVDGTEVTENVTLYAKLLTFGPAGVVEGIVNYAEGKEYGYNYNAETGVFTSANKGISSSTSIMQFTFIKDSLVTFDYTVSSEANYDILRFYLNEATTANELFNSKTAGAQNATLFSGSFAHTFSAGDTLIIRYNKDGSGDKGTDEATISNLRINDGIPGLTITVDFNNDEANGSVSAPMNSTILEIADLIALNPQDTDSVKFGGWYYDEACTSKVEAEDKLIDAITVYALYLYPATITFDTDGNGTIDPISVWTDTPVELPEAPVKDGYIFRGWIDELGDAFNAEAGVKASCTLTATFEPLPTGASMGVADVITVVDGSYVKEEFATTEEFQDYYFVFTPTTTDVYYFTLTSKVKVGGTISYESSTRFKVIDSEGTEVVGKTSENANVKLVAGATYYVVFNMTGFDASKTGWGTFAMKVMTYAHDSADEALTYTFGEEATTDLGLFVDSNHTVVYKFTATTTGTYCLKLSTTASFCSMHVYDDEALSHSVVNYFRPTDVTTDFAIVEGTTYYIKLSQNWSSSDCASRTITFSVSDYQQGYTASNPFTYELSSVVTESFTGGKKAYYTVEITEAGTYKLSTMFDDSNTRNVDVIDSEGNIVKTHDNKDFKLSGSTQSSIITESLAAGTYTIVAYCGYTISAFDFSLVKMEAGTYWTTADSLALAETMNVAPTADGHYYSFTTGEAKLWYFFDVTGATIVVSNSDRTALGATAIQLEANTTYYMVVTGTDETASITMSTETEYADGKSPAGAFTYTDRINLPIGNIGKSTEIYVKFTATTTGTYRFYTNNTGTIDTKGYVYDNAEYAGTSTSNGRLGYNDDGGNSMVGVIGYRYDFYLELDVVEGTTYYVKVTYTIYAANSDKTMFLAIEPKPAE